MVTEIDWRTLKLFDLSKARVRIAMKDRSILPALIKVTNEDWVFTISVAVNGVEDDRRGSVMGDSTWEIFASHSGTGGGRRAERDKSMAEGSFHVGEAGRKKKGGERIMAEVHPVGTRGKRGQEVGNNWFLSPLFEFKKTAGSKKLNIGPVGTKKTGVARADRDEAFSGEGGRAFERKAQSLPIPSPLNVAKVGCNLKVLSWLGQRIGGKKPSDKMGSSRSEEVSAVGKGKVVSVELDIQTRGSAKKEAKIGSKKLWNTLFPPSFDRRQGLRSRSEPLLHGKPSSDSEEFPKEETFGARSQSERGFSASPLFFC